MSAVPPVAVVQVAMDDEAAPFLDRATEVAEPEAVGRAVYRRITLAGRPVVLVRSGVGFVAATAAATGVILHHGTGVPLISAGSVGGLAKGVAVGDVVLATHLVNANADARAFGYVLGQVPGMPPMYEADPALAEAVRRAASAGGLSGASDEPAAVSGGPAGAPDEPAAVSGGPAGAADGPAAPGSVLREGTIGSGERFVTTDLAAQLRVDFPDMLAVDMESAALGQLCHSFGTPFVSVRAVSDLCAPDGTEFLTHIDDAAERSARLVTAVIADLADARPHPFASA